MDCLRLCDSESASKDSEIFRFDKETALRELVCGAAAVEGDAAFVTATAAAAKEDLADSGSAAGVEATATASGATLIGEALEDSAGDRRSTEGDIDVGDRSIGECSFGDCLFADCSIRGLPFGDS